MGRLINADDVAENLMNSNWFDCDDIDVALQAVKLTDTIDPESLRPKAHWEDVVQDGPCRWSGKCSACKVRNDIPPVMLAHYCPNCGAKMEDTNEN